MLADISLFESNTIGQNNKSQMSMFNSDLTPLFDQFNTIKQAADRCGDIASSLQDYDEMAILVGKIADAQKQYEDELFSLRQKICKGIGEGLDDSDRKAYLKLSDDLKNEFQIDDPVLHRVGEIVAGVPKPTFNNNDADRLAEFDSLKREFIQSATSELMERADTLEESAGLEYRTIASSALNRAVESLQEITLEKSELPKLEAMLKQFSDTVSAAEVATVRPKLDLVKTKQAGDNIKRLLKT